MEQSSGAVEQLSRFMCGFFANTLSEPTGKPPDTSCTLGMECSVRCQVTVLATSVHARALTTAREDFLSVDGCAYRLKSQPS